MANLANDFPSGEATILRSSIGQLYHLLGQFSDSHDRVLIALLVLIEVAALMLGAFLLCRRLGALPVWTAIGGAVLLASGTLASADLARWFHPVYANVYNFAYAAGFIAIAATLDRRMVVAGLSIGLAATFHPAIALFFGLAAAAAVLTRLRQYSLAGLVGGAIAAAIVFGGWYLIAIRGAVISGGIDRQLFTDLTRLMGSHWFPVSLSVFGDRAWETLLPSVALLLAFVASLRLRDAPSSATDRQMLAAVVALMLVAAAGVVVSMVSTDPALLKLAMHRASLIALLLAGALLVPRLLALAAEGPVLLAIVAGGLVLMPYWRSHGIPVAGAAIFAVGVLAFQRGTLARLDRAAISVALFATAVIVLALAVAGHVGAVLTDTTAAIGIMRSSFFVLAVLALAVARLLRAPVVLAGAVAIGLWVWVPQADPMRPVEDRQRAQAFLDAQLWANRNTPPDRVFMLDPTMRYGWRQYSARPSFGVMREWLYSGWLYDTDPAVMAEGLRRARLLGLDLETYTEIARTDVIRAYNLLMADAARLFYGRDASALSAIARDNGISYVLMDKAKIVSRPALPVAFENEAFLILVP
ncbi:MAG: hypothetical protein AB7L36_08270 [Sphingomonadaceae bacterium]